MWYNNNNNNKYNNKNNDIIVYHGSENNSHKLLPTHIGTNSFSLGNIDVDRYGIFLSDNPEFAKEYGNNVKKFHINLKNPAIITSDLKQQFINTLDPFGEDREIWIWAKNASYDWQYFDNKLGERFVKWLQEEGYDGA